VEGLVGLELQLGEGSNDVVRCAAGKERVLVDEPRVIPVDEARAADLSVDRDQGDSDRKNAEDANAAARFYRPPLAQDGIPS